jgi:hypothetical protein
MSTIKLFNKAFVGKTVNYTDLAKLAYRVGYLIHPDCATKEVEDFIKNEKIDYNSTFYKEWQDVTSRSRIEIWRDQIVSYLYGYGLGEKVIPNHKGSKQPNFTKFKAIIPITKKEAIERCEKMLFSAIALKQETIEQILAILNQCNHILDINLVKNKEAKMWLYRATKTLPLDEVEMVRYLVFLATNKSLLIKDRETIQAIKTSKLSITKLIDSFGLEKLSSVFLRFKPLFLAFKTNKGNIHTINRLRKLAQKNHKPSKPGYWANILNNPSFIESFLDRLPELNNFKKITLIEAINIRLVQPKMRVFGIRNGKIWLQENKQTLNNIEYLEILKESLYNSLVESLKSKIATGSTVTVKIPKGVDLKIPKSEKSFIGNYPLGTYFDLSHTDCIVGIHRKAEDANGYLDFSATTAKNMKIGWNSEFYSKNNDIVFSGDIQSFDNSCEVAELFYAKNGFSNSYILKVNNYSRNDIIPFTFFMAQEKITKLRKNYMVNPNNIKFKIDLKTESKETAIGLLTQNNLILGVFRTGNKHVAGDSITNQYITYSLETFDCYVELEKLLLDSGYKIIHDKKEKEVNFDFTDFSKDSLINLLS